MARLEEAIYFAAKAHEGQKRKMTGIPYIVHPLEAAVIISTMTDDEDTIIAGLFHDTIEDAGITAKEIKDKFGARVSALVQGESEDKMEDRPPEETWLRRKEDSLLELRYTKDRSVKIMWLADKLSNIRSFYRQWLTQGDEVWSHLHQKDPKMQEWYYRTVAELTSDLKEYPAYKEYCEILDKIFGEKNENKA